MLSISSKLFLKLIIIAVIFAGCTNRYTYTNKSYHSGNSAGYSKNSTSNKKNTVRNTSNTLGKSGTIKNSSAMHRATMRPYEVFGKKYYPTVARIDDSFNGIASWYGPNFHAKKTSNGEIYNMYANTAAHKTLPMNTVVNVKNLDNGLETIVRINDRGPFVSGRIIDLSNKAAHAIDMVKKGTANVSITVLGFSGKIAKTMAEKSEVRSTSNYYIQVGVFAKAEGANVTKRKFEMILEKDYTVILKNGTLNNQAVKRVWISGFRSEQEAQDFKQSNDLQTAMIIAE